MLECWALYGYANLIWIPVALISWSPIDILNWIFVGVGLAVSTLFLVRNLSAISKSSPPRPAKLTHPNRYPVISSTPKQRAKLLLIIVVLLHAGLAITIKFLFFAHKSPISKKKQGGSGGGRVGGGGDDDDDAEDDRVKVLRLLLRA